MTDWRVSYQYLSEILGVQVQHETGSFGELRIDIKVSIHVDSHLLTDR